MRSIFVHNIQNFFEQPIRFLDHSTTQPIFHTPNQAIASFAIDDAIATAVSNDEAHATVRIWVHHNTIVLGIPDSRLPHLEKGLEYIHAKDYRAVIRNSGGLAVALDSGVVNISFIIPNKGKVSIHDGYDVMYYFVQQLFKAYTNKIKAYEIVGSYCPGDYDLSINGIKFAGISQRRIRDGIAVQIYIDVEGNSQERASIVRSFYSRSKGNEETSYIYPEVNPNVMGTISDLVSTPLEVQDVIQMVKDTLQELGTFIHTTDLLPSEEKVFYKRLEQMKKRNQKIKRFL